MAANAAALDRLKPKTAEAALAAFRMSVSYKEVVDSIKNAGPAIKSFQEKVSDSLAGLRKQAEDTRAASVAFGLYAAELQAAEDGIERFNLKLDGSQLPLGIMTGKMEGLGSVVAKVVKEGFEPLDPLLKTINTSTKRLGVSFDDLKPAMEVALTAGQQLLKDITEELKESQRLTDVFAEAQRLLDLEFKNQSASLDVLLAKQQALDEAREAALGLTKELTEEEKILRAALDELAGALTGSLLNGFEDLGEVMKNFALNIVGDILQSAFKSLLTDIFTQDEAIKKLAASWRSFLGLFGGGGTGTPKVPVPGVSGGDVATGGGSAGGGVGGLLGGAGAVGSIVGAISGVVSNFQFRRMNKLLDLIELNTRQTTRALTGAPEILGPKFGPFAPVPVTEGPFATSSSTSAFDDPSTFTPTNTTPTIPDQPTGLPFGPEAPTGPTGPSGGSGQQQGLGVLQILFAQSDILEGSLEQLEFQTDSLTVLKDEALGSRGLLEDIKAALSGIGNVAAGDPVVPILLGEIKESLTGTGELITEVQNTVIQAQKQFVFNRDIVVPIQERTANLVELILKEIQRGLTMPPVGPAAPQGSLI
jgi:hypothetical protein